MGNWFPCVAGMGGMSQNLHQVAPLLWSLRSSAEGLYVLPIDPLELSESRTARTNPLAAVGEVQADPRFPALALGWISRHELELG